MIDRTVRDRRLARRWHRVEFGLVAILLVVAGIGLWWSEINNSPALAANPAR